MLPGVFFRYGQRRRADVDGRDAAVGQVLGQADGDNAAARADVGDFGRRGKGEGGDVTWDLVIGSSPATGH